MGANDASQGEAGQAGDDQPRAARPSTPPPGHLITNPSLIHYQTLTPRAPLTPGRDILMFPPPHHAAHRPPDVPAHWAADPSEQHQWRWWDGRRWTEYVADQGEAGIDPLD
jgi:hypothetical protein